MPTNELRPCGQWLNLVGAFSGLLLSAAVATAADWPGFRGPNGSGISDTRGLPVEFGPNTNLQWKATVSAGNSSPVIAGNCVLLAGYENDRRIVSCFDRNTGGS